MEEADTSPGLGQQFSCLTMGNPNWESAETA